MECLASLEVGLERERNSALAPYKCRLIALVLTSWLRDRMAAASLTLHSLFQVQRAAQLVHAALMSRSLVLAAPSTAFACRQVCALAVHLQT